MTRGVKGTARCGTASGYRRHQADAEKPCDACAAAKREYDQNWRAAPERVQKSRLSARAQARAHGRLVAIYPAVYAALYADEKDKAFRDAGLPAEGVREW